MVNIYDDKIWWDYLEEDLQELLNESRTLLNKVEKWEEKFHDYAFIVFPTAKAYEGFLKKLFLDLGFITEKDYSGKRFRIGKALNPSLVVKYRNRGNVYGQIINYCGGKELANELWDTWKSCRNRLFHWFPNEKNAISYVEAKQKVERVINAIDMAHTECKIERNK